MIILSDLFNKVKKRISMRKKRKIYEEFFKQNIMKFNFFSNTNNNNYKFNLSLKNKCKCAGILYHSFIKNSTEI